jgi:isoleucyl-tRNA synthetase
MLRLAMRPAALQQRGRMALAPVSLLPCRGLAKKAKQAEPTPKPKLTADAPLKAKKTYRPTMLLPKTAFEIQAKAHERDHLWAQRTTVDLYRWQAQHNPGPRFVLADGPPYANGPLHMGHALNKILKDIINRFQVLQGRKVHYEPGWDCHGLPIEIKAKGHLATLKIEATPSQVRDKAREVAVSAMEQQQDEFSAFGIMADWSRETTYRTLDPAYEVRQLKVFGEMVRRGLVYRAYRPVYWSPSSRTALAEAELEYDLNHVSRSVFVRFNFVPGEAFREACADNVIVKRALSRDEQISLVIWTTTPWTLPSNMAVAVNRDITYRLVRVTEGPTAGELLIVAAERAHDLSQRKVGLSEFASADRAKLGEFETLAEFSGAALSGSSYRHLFLRRGAESRPILAADYVTDTSGTGLVHCAPAHGQEDYALYRNTPALAKEPLLSPVDAAGRYTEDVLQCGSVAENLPGNAVTGTGGSIVRDLLAESGALLSEWPITHSFPCDWRTKQPVITR